MSPLKAHQYLLLAQLSEAEQWFQESLDLRPAADALGQGKCLVRLAAVAYENYDRLRKNRSREQEARAFLQRALDLGTKSLATLPSTAKEDLAEAYDLAGQA